MTSPEYQSSIPLEVNTSEPEIFYGRPHPVFLNIMGITFMGGIEGAKVVDMVKKAAPLSAYIQDGLSLSKWTESMVKMPLEAGVIVAALSTGLYMAFKDDLDPSKRLAKILGVSAVAGALVAATLSPNLATPADVATNYLLTLSTTLLAGNIFRNAPYNDVSM